MPRSAKSQVMWDIVKGDKHSEVVPVGRQTALEQSVWDTIKADPGMQSATPLQRAAMLLRLAYRLQRRSMTMYEAAPDPGA